MLLKEAIAHQESKKKLNSKNIYSGAAGKYQYMPTTALGVVRKAKSEGINVPYRGRMTEEDMSHTLRTDPKFNEWLADYDLDEKIDIFDGNPGLIFMGHYTDPNQLKASLQKVYPGLKSYAKVDIEDFAQKRARMGNRWLVKPQARDHPSILEYGLEVTNRYERLLARNN
jgi:hypothetical protein